MNMFAGLSGMQSINPAAQVALQGKALSGINSNPYDMGSQYLDLMRQQSKPYEQQAMSMLNDNLFSRGRLGDDTGFGGTSDAYKGFAAGLDQADLQRQLSAAQMGQTNQNNLFQQGISALGAGDSLQTSALQRSIGAAGAYSGLANTSTLPFQLALQYAQAQSQAALGQAGAQLNYGANSGFNAIMKDWSQFTGGGPGAGSSMLNQTTNFSDPRAKTDVVLVSEYKGIPVYSYRLKWDTPETRRIGVMSDDVKHIPGAVIKGADGYDRVNYDVVFGA
jgi:hypothetical protein